MPESNDGHNQFCQVFADCKLGEPPNETRPCTCGYRLRQMQRKMEEVARYRALTPLGMTDEEFLHTLGIKPGEDY